MVERKISRRRFEFLDVPPVLISESQADFDLFRAKVCAEISVLSPIEQIYADDFVNISWDIVRLRRIKPALINKSFLSAIERVLEQMEVSRELVEKEAFECMRDPASKRELLCRLQEIGLDDSVIEAEAFQAVYSELEALERMQASLEWRRSKALNSLAAYRDHVAAQLTQSCDHIIRSLCPSEPEGQGRSKLRKLDAGDGPTAV